LGDSGGADHVRKQEAEQMTTQEQNDIDIQTAWLLATLTETEKSFQVARDRYENARTAVERHFHGINGTHQ